ncbi:winged helix-turn-helix transcriptional regulator [Bacillus sp. FJAT-49736]|nr:winged helix-turn-helix transcriptional regulator [Bacillus sp. FJAT-49736]
MFFQEMVMRLGELNAIIAWKEDGQLKNQIGHLFLQFQHFSPIVNLIKHLIKCGLLSGLLRKIVIRGLKNCSFLSYSFYIITSLMYYYPVANESIYPNDRYTPNCLLVLKHKALGDEARLRMIKLLYEGDRTLQEITEHLDIGKSTIHHHLKILRSARLIEIIQSKYSLKRKSIEFVEERIGVFFERLVYG